MGKPPVDEKSTGIVSPTMIYTVAELDSSTGDPVSLADTVSRYRCLTAASKLTSVVRAPVVELTEKFLSSCPEEMEYSSG